MNSECRAIEEAGLQFFGKMTASISHEIKNVLAIINESAGLLEDLTLMTEKGMPAEMNRFKDQSEKIMRQVRRADAIIKHLNRFAHSIDTGAKSIDLHDIAEFIVALSSRLAAMRGVTLESRKPSKPVMVYMDPFRLENILYLCLESAVDWAGKNKTITLFIEEQEKQARVRFTKIASPGGTPATPFPGERLSALVECLKARVEYHEQDGDIILSLPADR